jgi:carboxypeptidase T
MKISRLVIVFLITLTALLLVAGILASVGLAAKPLSQAGDQNALSIFDRQPPPGEGPWVVRAYYQDRQIVNQLAAQIEPWEVHHDQGYLVVAVNQYEFEWMQQLGFDLEIDWDLTQLYNQPHVKLPGQLTGIPGYPCYRTVEETFSTAENLALSYPNLANWIDIGDSWEKITPGGATGYDLRLLRLTNTGIPGPKPKLFVMSSIHAREYAPAELNTRFAEHLLTNYDVDPDITWLLDYHEIHLLLQSNPDGRKWAENGYSWRKNTDNNFCSDTTSRGVDLNRNFEFLWGCCGGSSSDPCSSTFRGPNAVSEPETQAVMAYLRSQYPDQRDDPLSDPAPPNATGLFLDIHSYGRLVLWPWGFTSTPPPNASALQTLGRKFAYLNRYEPDQSIELYPTDGTTDDFAYGELGLAAYTFELGNYFFQSCSRFNSIIVPDNLPVLTYAAKVARYPYLTPAGPDILDLSITPTLATLGTPIFLSATADDTRYYDTIGSEPSQDIIAAEYYLDIPPWITTTTSTPYPLTAVDGSFDAPIEDVIGSISTAGLSVGRHTIFVRGLDATGNWGPFSAIFLTVESADPTAAFDSNSPVYLGDPLHFYNQSFGTPPLSYFWDFGDNLGTSIELNPNYTYSTTGTFTVSLVVTNDLGSAQISHPVLIQPCIPLDGITLTQLTTGTLFLGEPVQFTIDNSPDDASAPYTYTVNYADGTPPLTTNTDLGPLPLSHNFVTTGTLNVSIAVWNCDQLFPLVDTIEVFISERSGLTLSPTSSARVSPPGTTVTHTLRLTNIGDSSDIFDLSIAGNLWDTTLPDTPIGPILPGAGTQLDFVVTIPPNALAEQDKATITLTSQNDPTQVLTTTLNSLALWPVYLPQTFNP